MAVDNKVILRLTLLLPSLAVLYSKCSVDYSVIISTFLSALIGVVTYFAIPTTSAAFIKAGLSGKDLLKKDRPLL
jgi:hypothetical protein